MSGNSGTALDADFVELYEIVKRMARPEIAECDRQAFASSAKVLIAGMRSSLAGVPARPDERPMERRLFFVLSALWDGGVFEARHANDGDSLVFVVNLFDGKGEREFESSLETLSILSAIDEARGVTGGC